MPTATRTRNNTTTRDQTPPALLISACLLGQPCRYDGRSKTHEAVTAYVRGQKAAGVTVIAVCPEELGDLGTPRPAAELRGGDGEAVWRGEAMVQRVHDGSDVTAAFQRGAARALALVPGVQAAVLKARSPSCGVGACHRDGRVQPGDGVFAALLRRAGVALQTEADVRRQLDDLDSAPRPAKMRHLPPEEPS